MKSKIVSVVAAVAALMGVSSAASAQDGLRFNWSGAYFGAGVGGISSQSSWQFTSVDLGVPAASVSDAILALHAGYQHHFTGGLLIGAEAGFGRTLGASFSSPSCPSAAFNCQTRIDNLFTVGGKVGFAVHHLLLYASGGYAQANVSTQGVATTNNGVTNNNAVTELISLKHGGTYLGGGFGYALTKSFSIGIDYKHIDLARAAHCSTSACTGASRFVESQADVVTARFSYKFNDERHYRPLK